LYMTQDGFQTQENFDVDRQSDQTGLTDNHPS
jgi:hypothetical protein